MRVWYGGMYSIHEWVDIHFICYVSLGIFSPLDSNEAPLPNVNIVTPSDASRYYNETDKDLF